MENLKESEIANPVTNEGLNQTDFETEKKGGLLEYVTAERNENEEAEMQLLISATVKDPLRNIKSAYANKNRIAQSDKKENDSELDLKLAEEKAKSEFNIENLKILLGREQSRQDIVRELLDFFDEKGGFVVSENIEEKSSYSYKGAKGFPIEIARAVNESIYQAIENEGISNIEDNPKLFNLLDDTVKFCPDSLTEEMKNSFVDLVIERGTGLKMSVLSECENLVTLAEESDKKEMFNSILQEKVDALFSEKRWEEVYCSYRSYSAKVGVMARESLESYFNAIGVDFSKLRGAWGSDTMSPENFRMNMEQIDRVELRRPGITKALMQEFGIKEFRRYSTDLLIRQFDEKDKTGPYGILLYTNDDHNDAFDADADKIDKFSEQLDGEEMMLRIGEFDSSYELIKRLAVFNDRYGDKEKISYMILGSHGSESGFSTGDYSRRVDKAALEGEGMKKIKNFFVENPDIVLVSCSTGAENGIAQEIAETYGATVFAPEISTSMKSIGISFDENKKPHLSVDYSFDYEKYPLSQGDPLRVYTRRKTKEEELAEEEKWQASIAEQEAADKAWEEANPDWDK